MDLKELQKTVTQLEIVAADLKGLKNLDMSNIVEQVYTLNDEFEEVRKNLKSTQSLGLKFVFLSVICSVVSFFALGYVKQNNYFGLIQNDFGFEKVEFDNEKYLKINKKQISESKSDPQIYYVRIK